ncbi:DNA-binding barrel domain superfamily [Sesbania bispinosa]|nr:DNA-binding barrel domain superfamily [Sesbania bispinosa]
MAFVIPPPPFFPNKEGCLHEYELVKGRWEGWNSFALDHGLEIGELLIFNCINRLQFDVKIYGGTLNSVENISKNDDNNGSAQAMYMSEHCEDLCYMASLEFEDEERDNNTCGLDGTMKITAGDSKVSHVNHGSHIYQTNATLCNKDSMFKGILGTGAASDASDLEMSGRNNSLSESDKSVYDKTSTLKIEENRENKSIMSDQEVQVCQFTEGLGEISETGEKELVTSEGCSYKDELGATGLPMVVKGELGHSSHSFNEDNESHFETAATVSCVVPTDNDYLELPECLPLSRRAKVGAKVGVKTMVVLLRDPLSRLWPVLYHEETAFKLLTYGWLDFQRSNNIQPGDECVFVVENKSERIFNVHIVHKGC